jgi:hypothetical protein
LLDGHCGSHLLDGAKQYHVRIILEISKTSESCIMGKLKRCHGGHGPRAGDVHIDAVDVITDDLKMAENTFLAFCSVFLGTSEDLGVVFESVLLSEGRKVRVAFGREDLDSFELFIVGGDETDGLFVHDGCTFWPWGRQPSRRFWIRWSGVTASDWHVEFDHQPNLRGASCATFEIIMYPAISGIVPVHSILGIFLSGQASADLQGLLAVIFGKVLLCFWIVEILQSLQGLVVVVVVVVVVVKSVR